MGTVINLSTKCFICGKFANLKNHDSKVFSASAVKIGDKTGCICIDCVKKLYEQNKQYITNDDSKASVTSSVKSKPKDNKHKSTTHKADTASKKDESLLSLAEKWRCLDFSLDSYVELVKKHVFGQENAIKRTVFAMYANQYLNLIEELGLPTPARKQIFLIGSTGVGKSFLAVTAAKALGVPYARSLADTMTAAGYIGDKVESILERLLDATDGDLNRAEQGIVIIDEIDKKATKEARGDRDINGKAVQQELLKVLEASEVWIKHHTIKFNTSRLTIVLGGAFVGLEKIIEERLYPKRIGFTDSQEIEKDLLKKVKGCDLEKYGFIQEFIGRTPFPVVLDDLSSDTITDIVYAKLLEEDVLFKSKGCDLIISPFAVNKITQEVMAQKTGARDVKKELDELLYPAEFILLNSPPGGSCEIDDYGNITYLHTDKKTGKPVVEEISSTLEYLLEDEFDDDD